MTFNERGEPVYINKYLRERKEHRGRCGCCIFLYMLFILVYFVFGLYKEKLEKGWVILASLVTLLNAYEVVYLFYAASRWWFRNAMKKTKRDLDNLIMMKARLTEKMNAVDDAAADSRIKKAAYERLIKTYDYRIKEASESLKEIEDIYGDTIIQNEQDKIKKGTD